MSETGQHFHVDVTAPEQSATDLLEACSGLSRGKIKTAMSRGAVWLTRENSSRRFRRAKGKLLPGDRLDLHYDPGILDWQPPKPVLIKDAGSWSVWYKPPGLMSSGSRFGDHGAIDRVVEQQTSRASFLVHRLDRWADGLILLAHQRKTAAHLAGQFRDRTVEKYYAAEVEGIVTDALTITLELDGKPAISHVRPVSQGDGCTLVEIVIETGRKHQIRRHLATAGHPLRGDRQYGTATDAVPLALTAWRLAFTCPDTGQHRHFTLDEKLARHAIPVTTRPPADSGAGTLEGR